MRGARLYSLLFWILWGVISLVVRPDDRDSPGSVIAGFLGSFVAPILLYMWCKADAAARSVQPPPGAIPLLAVLLPVGWAYYIFATRSLLRAIGVIVCSILFAGGIVVAGAVVSHSATTPESYGQSE